MTVESNTEARFTKQRDSYRTLDQGAPIALQQTDQEVKLSVEDIVHEVLRANYGLARMLCSLVVEVGKTNDKMRQDGDPMDAREALVEYLQKYIADGHY